MREEMLDDPEATHIKSIENVFQNPDLGALKNRSSRL